MGTLRSGLVVAVMAAVLATPAMACQPTHGTPEEIVAKVRVLQADMWDKADLVFVARIEQRRTRKIGDWHDAPQVALVPLTWLKGQGGPWQFELSATGRSMCSLIPGFEVMRGQVGQEFLVFAVGDTPMQESIIDAIGMDSLVEPRALAALKAQE